MLIKGKKFGKKFMFYIKDMTVNLKVACGNIEHLHGDERCRFLCSKRLFMSLFQYNSIKNCVVNKLFNVVIGLGYVQKCLI